MLCIRLCNPQFANLHKSCGNQKNRLSEFFWKCTSLNLLKIRLYGIDAKFYFLDIFIVGDSNSHAISSLFYREPTQRIAHLLLKRLKRQFHLFELKIRVRFFGYNIQLP